MEEQVNLNVIDPTKEQAGYTDADSAPNLDDYIQEESDDVFVASANEERLNASTGKVVEDKTNYTCDDPKILIERKKLVSLLAQVGAILDTNARRLVARGITLRVSSETNIEVITPGEMYYFKADVEPIECTLPVGTTIFLDYTFLQKINSFLPPKVLIYKKVETKNEQEFTKYYVRLTTDDLELLNCNLIASDVQRLDSNKEILDKVKDVSITDLAASLNTLFKVLPFQSDVQRRVVSIKDGNLVFQSSMLYVQSKCDMIDVVLRKREVDYLLRASKIADKSAKMEIYNVKSDITEYAFVYDNVTMITNFANPKTDPVVTEAMSNLPTLVKVDYNQLKYHLSYANSITYALGQIKLENNNEGGITGNIKLSGGSTSPFTLPTESKISLPGDKAVLLNSKTFYNSVNTLDASQETKIGFKTGMMYLVNNDVCMIIVTI